MSKIEIGKIVNTHGLKGHIKVEPWCDGIETFEYLKRVFIGDDEYKIQSVKLQKSMFLVKLEGVDYIEQGELLKNKIIYAMEDELPPLPEGVYYIKDIMGLKVFENGKQIGEIYDWIETGRNNVYVIKVPNAKDILIPNIDSVVKKVDIENGIMEVELMEGLSVDDN